MSNTNDEKKYSREIVTSILGIMILVLLLFSTSYATFVEGIEGTKINSLTTGYLRLSYTNNDNNTINLTDALPISDVIAKTDIISGKVFDFTVSNSFMSDINYDLVVEEFVSDIEPKYLKIYLMDANGNVLEGFDNCPTLDSFSYTEVSEEKVIYSNRLTGASQSFKLKVWVSDEYTGNDPVTFSFKVSVRGTI